MDDYRENQVEFAMTTKGIWYCSKLNVSKDDVLEALDTASKAMGKANKILGQRNRYRQQKDKDEEKK